MAGTTSNLRNPDEFKIEPAKQVTERGLPVAEVASRLGMSASNLYTWTKPYSTPHE
ncbi:transposase [Pseudomonas sp. JG-B]|nr:transposase [Pseudomonas sp. JG-B]